MSAARVTRAPRRILVPQLPAPWLTAVTESLPDLTREIVAKIRTEIPEYSLDPTGLISAEAQSAVRDALFMFVETIAKGGGMNAAQCDVFRRLGRIEAEAGRSHDALQAAYRAASQAVTHQMLDWERQFRAPRKVMGELSAAMFTFIDELARLSGEGYAEAELGRGDTMRARTALVAFLISQRPIPRAEIEEQAGRLRWPVPDEVIFAEVVADMAMPDDALVQLAEDVFGPEAIAASVAGRQLVLAAAPVAAADVRARLLTAAVPVRIYLGPTARVVDSADSARIAHRAARSVRMRASLVDNVLACDDVLLDLFGESAGEVMRVLAVRRLAPMMHLTPAKRLKYARLLSAWLEFGSTRAEAPGVLDKHRQTLRYQVTQLERMFGEELNDRTSRLELMLALRAVLPTWEQEATVATGRSRSV